MTTIGSRRPIANDILHIIPNEAKRIPLPTGYFLPLMSLVNRRTLSTARGSICEEAHGECHSELFTLGQLWWFAEESAATLRGLAVDAGDSTVVIPQHDWSHDRAPCLGFPPSCLGPLGPPPPPHPESH